MGTFLREQSITPTEYDEPMVRRLIEKVIVYEENFAVEIKSGVTWTWMNMPENDLGTLRDGHRCLGLY